VLPAKIGRRVGLVLLQRSDDLLVKLDRFIRPCPGGRRAFNGQGQSASLLFAVTS